jgi:hypothetical protein
MLLVLCAFDHERPENQTDELMAAPCSLLEAAVTDTFESNGGLFQI